MNLREIIYWVILIAFFSLITILITSKKISGRWALYGALGGFYVGIILPEILGGSDSFFDNNFLLWLVTFVIVGIVGGVSTGHIYSQE